MAIKDYNTDPDLNVQISGINIAEGCPPSGINNAIRQLMADVKAEQDVRGEEWATQSAKDAGQDEAIAGAQSTANAAQSSADAAQSSADAAQSSADAAQSSADAANQGLVGVVRTVNGVNADAAGNVNVISTIMPDYSAGVTYAWDTQHTAPSNGFLYVRAWGQQTPFIQLIVDGITLYVGERIDKYGGVATLMIPISKNSTFKAIGGTASIDNISRTIILFPLKGV